MMFSPEMLKTFELCPKKYYYRYVLEISLPQNKFLFETGKKIHAIANCYLKGLDVSKLESVLQDSEAGIWHELKKSKYFKMEIVNTEYTLSSKVGDYWISGRLDALVKDGEDYYILDYKTGGLSENPEKDFQTMVYLLSVDKLLKHQFNSLKFVYLDLKHNKEQVIEFSSDLKTTYENKIISVCDAITFAVESNNFRVKKNKCNCDYLRLCI